MNKNKPLVSIVIPTYNRDDMLLRTIESVLTQTYKNIEIIVIDDNLSTSLYRIKTEYIISSLSDSRLIYYKHDTNLGGSVARNTGIGIAKGKFITFLDDDDEFLPTRVEDIINALEQLDESWIGCYTGFSRYRNNKFFDKSSDNYYGDLHLSILKNEIFINAGSNLFLKTTIVKQLGGFDTKFKRYQDLEFAIRASKMGKIAFIDKKLLKINLHDKQLTVDDTKLFEYNKVFLTQLRGYYTNLSSKDKIQVLLSKSLDLFKYYLYKKKILKAIKLLHDEKISLVTSTRYILYLIYRRLSKKCYGFKFSKRSE